VDNPAIIRHRDRHGVIHSAITAGSGFKKAEVNPLMARMPLTGSAPPLIHAAEKHTGIEDQPIDPDGPKLVDGNYLMDKSV